jgi:hypothetical protein
MKVGTLVRHRFDGRWDEVGVITEIISGFRDSTKEAHNTRHWQMACVLWNVEHTHRNNRLYRTRDLEIVAGLN